MTRPVREDSRKGFFDIDPDWVKYWWGMPEFSQRDAMPLYRIVMNFMTKQDVEKFAKATELPVTTQSNSVWYPHQGRRQACIWRGPVVEPRYPICILSKGRAKHSTTVRLLREMGVTNYRVFVEETEAEEYAAELGSNCLVVMPFHDLGRGGIPARNFIWEWAAEREHARYWIIDDNMRSFGRTHNNARWKASTAAIFRVMEDFTDRYENIPMAGPHDRAFIMDRNPKLTPVLWNSRIYSCILLDTKQTFRWRGRYNEDTDLSLRFLKAGFPTCLFRAIYMAKHVTSGGSGKGVPGGNTDTVYATGDRRRAFAESLRKQHPDCVKVVWKFNRWHHQVDYSRFARNKPVLKEGIVPTGETDDYGMYLEYVDGDG